MTVLEEGSLRLSLPDGVDGRKFDDETHGLSHCMKAVDFIVQTSERILFIEFKDPDHPRAHPEDRERFLEELQTGGQDDALVRKFRDSFIYQWAASAVDKPIEYYVLIAASHLDEAMLLARTEELKRRLPLKGPESGAWRRQLVTRCGVFNIETWNRMLSKYPVSRA